MTKQDIDISCVIVTWNSEKTIGTCIEHLQKYIRGAQIVVVDSASSDDTVNLVKSQYPDVTVVSSENNIGFAKANNIGVRYCKFDNLLLVNPDVIVNTDGVVKLFTYLSDEVGIVSCRLQDGSGHLQGSCFNFDNPWSIILEQTKIGKFLPEGLRSKVAPYQTQQNHVLYPDWVIGAFLCMKKSEYLHIGGFSEDYFLYAEDMDLGYKVHLDGKKTFYTPEVSVTHLGGQSESQDKRSRKIVKVMRSKKIFADKYGFKSNMGWLQLCYQLKTWLSILADRETHERYQDALRAIKEVRKDDFS